MTTNLPDRRRIEALERETAALRKELARGRLDQSKAPRHIYLAITEAAKDENGEPTEEYPDRNSQPNAFPIKFLDPSFTPEEPGIVVLDTTAKKAELRRQAVALSTSGKYIEEGTVVTVFVQRGKKSDPIGKWYIIDGADAEQLIHFRLQKPLTCGGSALAYRIRWDKDAGDFVDGEEIKVFDDYGDRAVQGSDEYVGTFKGWAAPRGSIGEKEDPEDEEEPEPPPEYTIVEIDHVARFIEGRAYAVSGTNSFYILLSRWYDGQKPEVTLGQTEEELVEVVDNLGGEQFFPRIPAGSEAWIKAIYDPCQDYYTVWQAQQMCKRFEVFSSAPACGTTIPIFPDYYERMDFSPFNLWPATLPVSAQNPQGHAVEAFDWMKIEWDEDLFDWVVTDVELKAVDAIIDIRHTACAIQGKKQRIYVERCGGDQGWENLIEMEEHIYVDGVEQITENGECQLRATFGALCAFPSETDPGHVTVLEWANETFVEAVAIVGNTLVEYTVSVPILVGCTIDRDEEIIAELDTCGSQSQSQGGEIV